MEAITEIHNLPKFSELTKGYSTPTTKAYKTTPNMENKDYRSHKNRKSAVIYAKELHLNSLFCLVDLFRICTIKMHRNGKIGHPYSISTIKKIISFSPFTFSKFFCLV